MTHCAQRLDDARPRLKGQTSVRRFGADDACAGLDSGPDASDRTPSTWMAVHRPPSAHRVRRWLFIGRRAHTELVHRARPWRGALTCSNTREAGLVEGGVENKGAPEGAAKRPNEEAKRSPRDHGAQRRQAQGR